MGVSHYQDAGEEDERPPDRWASVRLSRLFLSFKILSSTAAVPTYNVQYLLLLLILSYSIFPFSGFKLCYRVLERLAGSAGV